MDCNIITNGINNGFVSEIEVVILRNLSEFAKYQSAMMIVNATYPSIKTQPYDINDMTIGLCYKMGTNNLPYTRFNTRKWQEVVSKPQAQEIINRLGLIQIAKMEAMITQYLSTHNMCEKDQNQIPTREKDMENETPKTKQEYSKEEIKQAESVNIQDFLSSSYPDQVALKGNQLLFKNTKEETVSINISESDKNGLFFNTATQNSGKGIINFLRQETGTSFKNAVNALLDFSQRQVAEPEQSEQEKAAIALY